MISAARNKTAQLLKSALSAIEEESPTSVPATTVASTPTTTTTTTTAAPTKPSTRSAIEKSLIDSREIYAIKQMCFRSPLLAPLGSDAYWALEAARNKLKVGLNYTYAYLIA